MKYKIILPAFLLATILLSAYPQDLRLGQKLYSATVSKDFNLVKELLSQGADPNFATPRGDTPIIQSSKLNLKRITQALIDAGANVNVVDKNGWTGLMLAAREGFPSIVRKLSRAGADLDKKNTSGTTPLMLALRSLKHEGRVPQGRKKVVRELILRGASIPSNKDMKKHGIGEDNIAYLHKNAPRWRKRRDDLTSNKLNHLPLVLEDLILKMEK